LFLLEKWGKGARSVEAAYFAMPAGAMFGELFGSGEMGHFME
jgi:hypothetical protein